MTRKEFQDIDPISLIKAINPSMSPEAAVENVRLHNDIVFNSTKDPVYQARAELLREYGKDPNDWVYFSNTMAWEGEEFTQQDMERLTRAFPDEVDFLVLPGAFVGGVTTGISSWGWAKYKYNPKDYTAFIRVKRKLTG